MKKLILLLLFIPLVSFGQVGQENDSIYRTYYENGNLEFDTFVKNGFIMVKQKLL